MEISDELIQEVIPAIKNQMEMVQMPYVRETLTRLTKKEGIAEPEALEFMAQAFLICVNDMLLNKSASFDNKLYQTYLDALPALPDES
ncbi:MAG: hypothetical protein RR250_02525 [Akkermansia sp.]